MNVHGIIFPSGGTKTPSLLMRIKCRLVYGSHYFMSPDNDTRSWCGRCGLLHSFVPMPPKATEERKIMIGAPMVVPPEILEALMKDISLPMPIPIKKSQTPQQRQINQTIKDNVVWLVDEYRTRRGILPYVPLDEPQLDELINGIVDVIGMYEGVYVDIKKRPDLFDDEDEDDDNGKTA